MTLTPDHCYFDSIYKITILYAKTLFIFLIIFCISSKVDAQNCFNSDFETGNIDGYIPYTGSIDSEGIIDLSLQQYNPDQHAVFFTLDGYDEIAMEYCEENKFLPKVAPGSGAYALRLGNSNTGAQAEMVKLNFTVTEQNSFFLLRYAVILNNPNHNPEEQPRFQLRITDSNNNEYPCGYYQVVAAPEIENFENCDEDWKVRPWTNIGIELLSYLGEEINIEMFTTDCSRGGHAGYAYLDATCKPLEINVINYCDGYDVAELQVTPGFDSYMWNTGDTTSMISVGGISPGDAFEVTVTSATGCQLVLKDTIPNFIPELDPSFSESTSNFYCTDTAFWFFPAGANLENVYSVELDQFVDSILVNNVNQNEYTFIAMTSIGCPRDTVAHYFYGTPHINSTVTDIKCAGNLNGSITISPLASGIDPSYIWSTGDTTSILSNLDVGTYIVTVTNGNCEIVEEFYIDSIPRLEASSNFDPFECGDLDSKLYIYGNGGTWPYMSSFDEGETFSNNSYWDYKIGNNIVIMKDANGCTDTLNINIPYLPIDEVIVENTTCNEENGVAEIIVNAIDSVQFKVDSLEIQNSNQFYNLSEGNHKAYVYYDNTDCVDSISFYIQGSNLPQVAESLTNNLCFQDTNGAIQLLDLGNDSLSFTWSNGMTGSTISNLDNGLYSVTVTDQDSCQSDYEFEITSPTKLEFQIFGELSSCPNPSGFVEVSVTGGVNPYEYSIDNGANFQSENQFNNLGFGEYVLQIKDFYGCIKDTIITIDTFTTYSDIYVDVFQDNCGLEEISIQDITISEGTGPYQFSLDGINFQDSTHFSDLDISDYILTILDGNGCLWEETVSIFENDFSVQIESSDISTTTCGKSNGKVAIIATNDFGNQYKLNDGEFQNSSVFENLSANIYLLEIVNEYGCKDSLLFEIDSSLNVEMDLVNIQYNSCKNYANEIFINHHGGTPPFNYILDLSLVNDNGIFENLKPGEHIISVIDKFLCEDSKMIGIEEVLPLTAEIVNYENPECGEQNGFVEIASYGGLGNIEVIYNELSHNSMSFNGLENGDHTFYIQDTADCEIVLNQILNFDCNYYIPTVFSPNGDGINDVFDVFIGDQATANLISFQIFDRWGELLHNVENKEIPSYDSSWDGMFNRSEASSGTYVYYIKLEFYNGQIYSDSGTITIIR